MKKMSHIDDKGNARMVDISSKEVTARTATASGCIKLGSNASAAIDDDSAPKGDVFSTARDNDILFPIQNLEVPIFDGSNISGIEPAVPDGPGGKLRVFEVPLENAGTLDQYLPILGDPDLDSGYGFPHVSHANSAPVLVGDGAGCLGLSIPLL